MMWGSMHGGLVHVQNVTFLTSAVWGSVQKMEWSIHATQRAAYAQEARWWIPDADIKEVFIPVDTIADIMGHLQNMPESEIKRKLMEMQAERHRFTFQVLFPFKCTRPCITYGKPLSLHHIGRKVRHGLCIPRGEP